jgi:hypothetical protein
MRGASFHYKGNMASPTVLQNRASHCPPCSSEALQVSFLLKKRQRHQPALLLSLPPAFPCPPLLWGKRVSFRWSAQLTWAETQDDLDSSEGHKFRNRLFQIPGVLLVFSAVSLAPHLYRNSYRLFGFCFLFFGGIGVCTQCLRPKPHLQSILLWLFWTICPGWTWTSILVHACRLRHPLSTMLFLHTWQSVLLLLLRVRCTRS